LAVTAGSILGSVNPGGNRLLALRLNQLGGSFTMKSRLFTHLGTIGVLSVGLLAGTSAAPDYSNSFSAELTGDVRTTVSGAATFGRISGGSMAPDVFTVTLGADSSHGAVLFTQPGGRGLSLGSYRISEVGSNPGDIQALVVLGSPDQPHGVFRASAGTLIITSVSDHTLTGLFALHASGFLASAAEREDQRVSVSGSFTALHRN
jgi:hypothetical protein